MERKTRRPSAAERLAARVLGEPEPVVVEADPTPTGEKHAARLLAPRESSRPAGMATSDWYALRARGDDGPPAA